jgi:hypothetical protein
MSEVTETYSAQTRNEVLMFFDCWDRSLRLSPKDPRAQTARSPQSEGGIEIFARRRSLQTLVSKYRCGTIACFNL